jgi:hypothetical protein
MSWNMRYCNFFRKQETLQQFNNQFLVCQILPVSSQRCIRPKCILRICIEGSFLSFRHCRTWLSANNSQVWANHLLGNLPDSVTFNLSPSTTEYPLCLFPWVILEEQSINDLNPSRKGVSLRSGLTLVWYSMTAKQQCSVGSCVFPLNRNSAAFS